MAEKPARVLGEIPGPSESSPEAPPGDARELDTEGGGGLRAAGEAAALVSAGALVGGGVGMMGGFALGAINPFALGIMGVAAGAGVPVLLAVGARGATRRPWWGRVFGG